jgi:hypothetical protein
MKTPPLTVRIPEAVELSGIPEHVFQKSFMRPDRRPRGIPAPPPHVRVGRAIFILTAELPAWVASLGGGSPPSNTVPEAPRRRGRPTKVEQVARRQRGES